MISEYERVQALFKQALAEARSRGADRITALHFVTYGPLQETEGRLRNILRGLWVGTPAENARIVVRAGIKRFVCWNCCGLRFESDEEDATCPNCGHTAVWIPSEITFALERVETAEGTPRMIAFGPIPSRRLGHSLGVNNIPPKFCTYSCVYCQLGRTPHIQADRRTFYTPEEIARDVRRQVERTGGQIDYLTFVPDGEPTLDVNLGRSVVSLRSLSIPVAVITNSSLVWQEGVREDLSKADWVSLKVDSALEPTWRRINRPHRSLRLAAILDGMLSFAQSYKGMLVTETMLVAGVNDDEPSLRAVAAFLARLRPARAYISVPTRPPAEPWVRPPAEERVLRAHQIFSAAVGEAELLIGYEGDAFSATGDPREDLLRITAVHPMRREAVEALLARTGASWETVSGLVAEGLLVETEYEGRTFYARRI